eukprot:CAMPEP_0181451314 /NCGR_PEP_ID=MMETSP1110-20121109/28626_1 /TAXON_ID=174948 /ORGANISM="Symbiodinium sp., Strain CCMP421" /LENGTH=109 /DNA_ID=CAMNT_0023575559 /DNA_START=41 /DNA_END=371 /DNA_ORIENTATION=+
MSGQGRLVQALLFSTIAAVHSVSPAAPHGPRISLSWEADLAGDSFGLAHTLSEQGKVLQPVYFKFLDHESRTLVVSGAEYGAEASACQISEWPLKGTTAQDSIREEAPF